MPRKNCRSCPYDKKLSRSTYHLCTDPRPRQSFAPDNKPTFPLCHVYKK